MSNDILPPIAGVKVKIKDGGTEYYITYDETNHAIGASTTESAGYGFTKTTNRSGTKIKLQIGTSGYYLASNGTIPVRSNATPLAEWTLVTATTGSQTMHIHDNTSEFINISGGSLGIGATGSQVVV